jgi:hypothetical protein
MQTIFPFEFTDIELIHAEELLGDGLNFVKQSWSVILAENLHL